MVAMTSIQRHSHYSRHSLARREERITAGDLELHQTSLARCVALALVEPEYAINVGYAARVAANFGLTDLYLVIGKRESEPKFDSNLAQKFASHGNHLVSKAKTVTSLAALRHKFRFLVGTTAIQGKRKSNLTRKTLEVSECARRVMRLADPHGRNDQICLLLGRDTTGLTNEELKECDYVLSIKTGSEYNTLNISHAAAIILHEFSRAFKRETSATTDGRKSNHSFRRERDLVIKLFADLAILSDVNEFKRDKLDEALSRLLNRSDPTLRELHLLMGLASKSSTKIRLLSSGQKQVKSS